VPIEDLRGEVWDGEFRTDLSQFLDDAIIDRTCSVEWALALSN
jgi:hypothetical protein